MPQTTLDEWAKDPVDPETRAHVYSLITALGGIGDDGTYVLGDDALLCLKDLRRWLKFADGQNNRRDVARCMAEANLVKGDLLEILAKLSERAVHDRVKHKIAVSVLELLVPLTWPFEIDPELATVNHHRHAPYVQLAQIGYKRAILQFDRARILQTAVKLALPSMAEPLRERTPRDEGIIRISLYFIRNIAMLSPPKSVPMDIDEAEVSRSATLETFQEQDIFQVILSIASSIGEDYVSQDVIVLEILFFLLKGIDAEKLFMEEKKLNSKNTDELKSLIQKEKSMLAGQARHAPTRHNRFGTMIWVKRDDEKLSTLSGQDVFGKAQQSMQKMDKSKKWNKPRRPGRKQDEEQEREEFNLPVPLTSSARKHLKSFVEEFLDSSFNPLFLHLRKAIERETDRVETRHPRQFFYLVSWFLRAECARRRTMKERAADPKSHAVLSAEDESYGLVAEVMNQETFILLNRFMQKSQDEKAWQDLNAGMKCFTQILLTVQEMSESALEDDQEIAENIQNRIFYEETTHERVVHILRSYNNQGFGYLDAVTELSHVFLRMLERYSKQNVDMQVRSKRRARTIKKKQAQAQGLDGDEGHASETEDIQAAQRTVAERKFDFNRFAAKFVHQNSVNTFVAFTKYYQELDTEQLKRAHRFFHRVAFKMDIGVLLYRVDILQLFNKMIKGPEGLDPEMPSFKEWEEFVRHFFRAVVKKVQDIPELVVEMLFSKIPSTIFYLEFGRDRELPNRTPRAPAELEVKPGMEKPEQIGVAVGVMVNQQKSDALRWLRDVLTSASEERKSWEDMEEARKAAVAAEHPEGEAPPEDPEAEPPKPPSILIKPDNEERRVAMFRDNKLRLLMTLVGFMRLGEPSDPEASWIVPSSLTSAELQGAINLIRKYEFDPPVYEDGKGPEDMLRSKAAAQRRSARKADFDDDSDGDGRESEEDHGEYAVGGPTAVKGDGTRKKLIRRRRARTPDDIDDEERERRAEERRRKEIEKQAKTKSTMFVHDSDDEDWDAEKDAEFFAQEEATRTETMKAFKKSLALGSIELASSKTKKRKADDAPAKKNKKKKTPPKRGPFDDSEDDVMEGDDDDVSTSTRAPSEEAADVLEDESEVEATDTPLSSQHAPAVHASDDDEPARTATGTSKDSDAVMVDADGDEEEDVPVARKPAARSMRAGFVIDSDSEYPDRQNFEQIRSRWESAQPASSKPSRMPVRKEKQHDPDNAEVDTPGTKRFRRKLSQGFSLFSNPLAPRKASFGRQPSSSSSLLIKQTDSQDSPVCDSASLESRNVSPTQRATPTNNTSGSQEIDPDATPRPLPRSRTMSFIPLPSRSGSSSSTSGSDASKQPPPPAFTLDSPPAVTASKIPTPSPPISGRRRSSPRQYVPLHTSQDAKYIAAGNAFAGADSSPSKTSVRSYTTPNLVKKTNSPQPPSFMAPRKTNMNKTSAKQPGAQKPALKENMPMSDRDTRRISQYREKMQQRQSMAAPSARQSFGSSGIHGQSRQASETTSSVEKSQNSHFAPSPTTHMRAQPNRKSAPHPSVSSRNLNGTSIAQPRLMGPVSPPTPRVVNKPPTRVGLPRASTEKSLSRRTVGNASPHLGDAGVRQSSRSPTVTNTEVRLPRSTTYHTLRRREVIPPVPQIPEKYKVPSMPLLMAGLGTIFEPESPKEVQSKKAGITISEEDKDSKSARTLSLSSHSSSSLHGKGYDRLCSRTPSPDNVTALPQVPPPDAAGEKPAASSPVAEKTSGKQIPQREWSVPYSQKKSADVEPHLQVKEHMPPAYWAGRFQSRFDNWRTDAMHAELNPDFKPDGLLGKCKLSEERMATNYIFQGLRSLCVSSKAADSLWDFEYKYRADNNMLGTALNCPHPSSSRDASTARSGHFGRAVRKMTPRKGSLANLLRGKGWNPKEEAGTDAGHRDDDPTFGLGDTKT